VPNGFGLPHLLPGSEFRDKHYNTVFQDFVGLKNMTFYRFFQAQAKEFFATLSGQN